MTNETLNKGIAKLQELRKEHYDKPIINIVISILNEVFGSMKEDRDCIEARKKLLKKIKSCEENK